MSIYHQGNETLQTAFGNVIPIIGRDILTITYNSTEGIGSVLLREVTHAPELHYNLFSLRKVADNYYEYIDRKTGITIYLRTRGFLDLPPTGRLNYLYGARNDLERWPSEITNVVIAPSGAPVKPTYSRHQRLPLLPPPCFRGESSQDCGSDGTDAGGGAPRVRGLLNEQSDPGPHRDDEESGD